MVLAPEWNEYKEKKESKSFHSVQFPILDRTTQMKEHLCFYMISA